MVLSCSRFSRRITMKLFSIVSKLFVTIIWRADFDLILVYLLRNLPVQFNFWNHSIYSDLFWFWSLIHSTKWWGIKIERLLGAGTFFESTGDIDHGIWTYRLRSPIIPLRDFVNSNPVAQMNLHWSGFSYFFCDRTVPILQPLHVGVPWVWATHDLATLTDLDSVLFLKIKS